MKRNQVLIKEGSPCDYVYIVFDGQLAVKKNVYKKKLQESKYELDLLNKGTLISKRYCNSFFKQVGVKKNFELYLAYLGQGKMACDYEVLYNLPSQCTITCHTFKATVFQVSKELLIKIQHINEEFHQELMKVSLSTQNALKLSYLSKM